MAGFAHKQDAVRFDEGRVRQIATAEPADRASKWRGPRASLALDVVLILSVSLFSDLISFSFLQGRSVINGDSVQYVTDAEAMFRDDANPAFGLRKPGYALFLAGIKLLAGHIDWPAIVANHVLLVFFPLLAYLFGRHLHSRTLGLAAALLTVVQLRTVVLGDRLMSEVPYAFAMSLGLLLFFVGVRKPHVTKWMIPAGIMLGLAWLTRGTVGPVIGVMCGAVCVIHWPDLRKMITCGVALMAPILVFTLVECSVNHHYCGRFRLSTGTAGSATWFHRLRAFQGVAWPDSPESEQLLAFVPERQRGMQNLGSALDQWAARYRALNDAKMDDWEYDDLCRAVSRQAIAENTKEYIWWTTKGVLCHLLRRGSFWDCSPVVESRRDAHIPHPARVASGDTTRPWYSYWGLPLFNVEESVALTDKVERDSHLKAPFGQAAIWNSLRYWLNKRGIGDALALLHWIGRIWPGFALIGCAFLGLNRQTCYTLGLAMLLEALLISCVTTTYARYQFPWIIFDTTLAGAIPTVILIMIGRKVAALRGRGLSRDAATG